VKYVPIRRCVEKQLFRKYSFKKVCDFDTVIVRFQRFFISGGRKIFHFKQFLKINLGVPKFPVFSILFGFIEKKSSFIEIKEEYILAMIVLKKFSAIFQYLNSFIGVSSKKHLHGFLK
jgi:hypothetical protein